MRLIYSAILVLLLTPVLHAAPKEAIKPTRWNLGSKSLGIGANIGVPFGVNIKYWVNNDFAVAGAFGHFNKRADSHIDALWHFHDVLAKPEKGRLPLYLGLGVKTRNEKPTFAGIRLVGGVAYMLSRLPVEIFFEVAPVIRFLPDSGGSFDGAIGFHYYFLP